MSRWFSHHPGVLRPHALRFAKLSFPSATRKFTPSLPVLTRMMQPLMLTPPQTTHFLHLPTRPRARSLLLMPPKHLCSEALHTCFSLARVSCHLHHSYPLRPRVSHLPRQLSLRISISPALSLLPSFAERLSLTRLSLRPPARSSTRQLNSHLRIGRFRPLLLSLRRLCRPHLLHPSRTDKAPSRPLFLRGPVLLARVIVASHRIVARVARRVLFLLLSALHQRARPFRLRFRLLRPSSLSMLAILRSSLVPC